MKTPMILAMVLVAAGLSNVNAFSPQGWKGFKTIVVSENAGLARTDEPVDCQFNIKAAPDFNPESELRIVRIENGVQTEVAAQFHGIERRKDGLGGRAAFYVDMDANGTAVYRLYYGNKTAAKPEYASRFTLKKGDGGPRHFFIENDHYRAETMPKSGQVWHLWNKRGSNTSWHHNEWKENDDQGGDPCHWAPNCWVGYPERTTSGKFDWHYVFGWQNPEFELVQGPVFIEMRRRGVVYPHPEHTDTTLMRDRRDLTRAEVIYRFYDRLPWYYEASTYELLESVRAYFIRNNQMVFKTFVFDHMFISPETPGILPGDQEHLALFPLMGHADRKPYNIEHSLSNILPSKLGYYGYFNSKNHDGFANIQLTEENTNIYSGKPTYYNHATIFTELHGWSTYCARTMSYTNRRFNPENAVLLPKGENYFEENVYMVFRYEGNGTLGQINDIDRALKHPLKAEVQ